MKVQRLSIKSFFVNDESNFAKFQSSKWRRKTTFPEFVSLAARKVLNLSTYWRSKSLFSCDSYAGTTFSGNDNIKKAIRTSLSAHPPIRSHWLFAHFITAGIENQLTHSFYFIYIAIAWYRRSVHCYETRLRAKKKTLEYLGTSDCYRIQMDDVHRFYAFAPHVTAAPR